MLFRLNKGDGSLLCEKWSQVGERSHLWDHFEVMLALNLCAHGMPSHHQVIFEDTERSGVMKGLHSKVSATLTNMVQRGFVTAQFGHRGKFAKNANPLKFRDKSEKHF